MDRWLDFVSPVDAKRVVLALGGTYVALAVGRAILVVSAGDPFRHALVNLVLVGGLGVGILFVGSRLPQTDLHPTVYPRLLAWLLGAFGLMLGIVGLRVLDPSVTIDTPFWSGVLATALGSVAGLAIGLYDARAISRAHEVEQRSRALQRYSHELERQNERLESFAGMLAHELRNPLTIAQIYHQQAVDGDRDAAEHVETALDRIEEMVDILLVTARKADTDIDCESVAIADVATDAWADLSPEAEVADLVVETDRTIRADRMHLRHLLRNLFRNAVEHGSTSPGSHARQDAIEYGDGDLTVRVGDLEGEREGFYVEDDGPGILADERDEIAEPGYSTKPDGIGLGLTFVVELANMYDWNCTVTESETGGARFEFTEVDFTSPEGGTATAGE